MSIPDINLLAVLVSAIISFGIGFLWMTVLFSGPYGRHMYGVESLRKEDENVETTKKAFSFVVYILFSIITCYIFAVGLQMLPTNITEAFIYTLLVWLGFFVPFAINKVVWQEKSWIVAGIDASYEIVRLSVIMLVLYYWK